MFFVFRRAKVQTAPEVRSFFFFLAHANTPGGRGNMAVVLDVRSLTGWCSLRFGVFLSFRGGFSFVSGWFSFHFRVEGSQCDEGKAATAVSSTWCRADVFF